MAGSGMRIASRIGVSTLALAAVLVAAPALANDTAAELSVGGLTFTKSADIAMESEELTITPETVTVKYAFRNNSAAPVTLTIAFPLPDIDLAEAENYAFPTSDPNNLVGFETKVDGKPIALTMNQRALLAGKDVTETLRKANVPFFPLGTEQKRLAELPAAVREKLVNDGLMQQAGSDERGRPIYEGTWTVKMSAVRQQTFAPGKPVVVEHRYRTSVGASVDTVLRKGLRQKAGMAAEIDRYRKQYCISDGFLASLDKLAGSGEANSGKVREWRIAYVLKTGANWAGPIKSFHLTVDKGKAERLISFCAPNIKSISPTRLEVDAKDFTPESDLKILMIGKN